jgi:hypothetical protein
MHQVLFYCLMDARGSSRPRWDHPDHKEKALAEAEQVLFLFTPCLLDLVDQPPHLFG